MTSALLRWRQRLSQPRDAPPPSRHLAISCLLQILIGGALAFAWAYVPDDMPPWAFLAGLIVIFAMSSAIEPLARRVSGYRPPVEPASTDSRVRRWSIRLVLITVALVALFVDVPRVPGGLPTGVAVVVGGTVLVLVAAIAFMLAHERRSRRERA